MFSLSEPTDWYVRPGNTLHIRLLEADMTLLGLTTATKPPEYLNSGDSDASPNGTPSQFLLLRGLEPTVTEDLLAKGVTKLYKPGRRSSPPISSASKKSNAKVASTTGDANLGAKEGSLRRVLLVRDRRTNESWRYGFAEFGTVEVINALKWQWSFADDSSRMRKLLLLGSILLKNSQFLRNLLRLTTCMLEFSFRCLTQSIIRENLPSPR